MATTATSSSRPPPRMLSARDLRSTTWDHASPLAQLRQDAQASSHFASAGSTSTIPPIPSLDFNLFRTASISSVNSLSSLNTIRTEDTYHEAEDDGVARESPSTPKAGRSSRNGYFDLETRAQTPTRGIYSSQISALTPTGERQPIAYSPQPPTRPLPPPPVYKSPPPPIKRVDSDVQPDWASLHGEQGSEWGDDEAAFEWLDTDAPEAVNGEGTAGMGLSPSKRLSRLKAVVAGGRGHVEGRMLKKPLVFTRRAPPPPPPAEDDNLAKIISNPSQLKSRNAKTDQIVHSINHPPLRPPRRSEHTRRAELGPSGPFHSRPTQPQAPRRPPPLTLNPMMIPLKDTNTVLQHPKSSNMNRNRSSQMSFQSVAYSFYDLGDGSSTPRANTPTPGEVFPNGTYRKVSISRLEKEKELRERSKSDPARQTPVLGMSISQVGTVEQGGISGMEEISAEGYLGAGLEARANGDMARSAWYFMSAAERGSTAGRMYWGLALRHGWGVARDEKRAFTELRRACNESLAEGGLDFHHSPGTVKLTLQQRRKLSRDLSLGLFEVANCFLNGAGVKRAPSVALSYLRFSANMGDLASQEQLGFLLSKGSGGIKKDMKEAARWYRMAVAQGLTNTFGLAWIWKDKYMD